jgi:putative transposase
MEDPSDKFDQEGGLSRDNSCIAAGLFTSLFRRKVLETGGEWVTAQTQTLRHFRRCPQCWNLRRKRLSDPTHSCAQCGHTEPRDLASARVVLRWAMGTN